MNWRLWWWDVRLSVRWSLRRVCGRVTGHAWRTLFTAQSDTGKVYHVCECRWCGHRDVEWLP